jgi:hypothetical protein
MCKVQQTYTKISAETTLLRVRLTTRLLSVICRKRLTSQSKCKKRERTRERYKDKDTETKRYREKRYNKKRTRTKT